MLPGPERNLRAIGGCPLRDKIHPGGAFETEIVVVKKGRKALPPQTSGDSAA